MFNPARRSPIRTVEFPKNRILGELLIESYPAGFRSLAQMKSLGAARGEVIVPSGHRLILYIEKVINERGLKALAKLAPHDLQSLILRGCEITDSGLMHLRNLTWLEDLDLSGNQLSGEGLSHLGGMLLLERLELSGCELTAEGMGNLPPLPSLRHLSLALHLELPDDALAHLDRLPKLESLDLHNTPITDGALEHLRKLRQLRDLHISYTKISRDGASELCAALPLCHISWSHSSA
jgi:hypothetical protein